MLSNFHRTTSEHWWRTPGTQKGSPISSVGDRTKYKRQKETKDLGMETLPGEGVMKEKFPHSRKPSHRHVCGEFWNLRGHPLLTGPPSSRAGPSEPLPPRGPSCSHCSSLSVCRGRNAQKTEGHGSQGCRGPFGESGGADREFHLLLYLLHSLMLTVYTLVLS